MRTTLLTIGLLLTMILVSGCTQSVLTCNDPYIINGDSCCLDDDNNGICDADDVIRKAAELQCPPCELDCSSCPERTVDREVEIIRYVCPDGRTVDALEACDETPATINYDPVTTNEQGTQISTFRVVPACRASYPGGNLFYEVTTIPGEAVLEIKTLPDGTWEELMTLDSPVYKRNLYFVICDKRCPLGQSDFELAPGRLYVLRMRFDQSSVWNRTEYSNEHLVDTRDRGAYMQQVC